MGWGLGVRGWVGGGFVLQMRRISWAGGRSRMLRRSRDMFGECGGWFVFGGVVERV